MLMNNYNSHNRKKYEPKVQYIAYIVFAIRCMKL
jgi:hypothetical protein